MNKFPVWNLFSTIVLIVSLIVHVQLAIENNSLVIFVYGLVEGALFITVLLTWIYYIVKK